MATKDLFAPPSEEELAGDSKESSDMFAPPSETELGAAPEESDEPEMGRTEAAITSFGQGSGMGLTPIVSGAIGALGNVAEQAGDALGLTTDAQLESQGFTQPDKKTGLEGLMQAYYESRDAQKAQQAQAHQDYPVQSIAMNIAGSIPSTIAAGAASKAVPALSKVLPASQNLNQAKLTSQIAAGVQEGAKAGALAGFGEGDAKLFGDEGSIGDAISETAGGAIGGGLVGGVIPTAVGTVKNTLGLIPGAKSAKTGFALGRGGIDANEEGVAGAIKGYSEDLLGAIRGKFKQAGMTKANALDYADEVGVRVNAGENFDEIMEDVVSRGASSVEDQAEKLKLYRSLKNLKDGPANKAQGKFDTAQAKNIQKLEQKGFDLADTDTSKAHVSDLIPESPSDAQLRLANQTFEKPVLDKLGAQKFTKEGEPMVKAVERLVQQAEEVLPIDIKQFDLENLSLRDLEQVIGEINRHTGELTGPARTESEKIARQLAGQLRNLSQDALEKGGAKGNTQLANIFSATRKAGIEGGDILTKNTERTNEMVDTLRKMTAGGDRIKAERFFEYMKKTDPQFEKFETVGQFLNDASRLVKGLAEPTGGANIKSLLGSAESVIVKGANKAGKALSKFDGLAAATPEKLTQMAQSLGMSNSGAQSYINPLMKAAQADDRTRMAILYGLYQQPAFRQLYQDLGESSNEVIKQSIPGVTTEEE